MFVLDVSCTAFSVFGVDIYWYGIIYAFAVACSWSFAYKLTEHATQVITKTQFDKMMYKMIIYCIIFARLGHVLFFEPKYYIEHPSEIIMLRHGGLSFHGGVIGVVFALLTFAKNNNIKISILADILSFSGSIGIFIGRFANFINQELYGTATQAQYGVIFSTVDSIPRHPVQIYEALTEGLVNFIVMLLMKKCNVKIGTTMYAVVFISIYSISRFFTEFYKETDICMFELTTGQILSIIYFVITCVYCIILRIFYINQKTNYNK